MSEIVIPYTPRYPQTEIHKALESYRFCVLAAHRRMGKTVCVINHLIKQALLITRRDGFYGYVAPLLKQGKIIAWRYLKRFTAPIPQRKVNEGELSVTLPNGAVIRIFGADNPDALRGCYFDGIVLDEVAQMKPEIWEEIIRPALADRQGFAVFIGTPKGINLFSELYYRALKGDEGWHGAAYRADETGVLEPQELAALKAEMSDNSYRREMLCDFNAASDDVLISLDEVLAAAKRVHHPSAIQGAPVVLGVDVARFGDDSSVILRRQGLYSFEPIVERKLDNMVLADRIIREINQHKPQAVFIDAGRGEGVIDRLRQLHYEVVDINFGGRAGDEKKYANKRAEMWSLMADWLKSGGVIHDSLSLKTDLTTPTYSFDAQGRLVLEAKDKIKGRTGRSPDAADALALTFAAPVAGPEIEYGKGPALVYDPLEALLQ